MSAPAVVLVFPLEGKPHVYSTADREGDQLRLQDWIRETEDVRELFEHAIDVLEKRAA